jgi:CRP/FNR family transcriptional regulator
MDCRNCKNLGCFINKYCLTGWLEYTQQRKTSKYLSPAKTIFSEGDFVTGIFVICSGKAKIVLKTVKGEEQIIRVAGKGQVLGHRGFSEKMIYPITATTLVDSEIAYIPNEDFFRLIRANKDLAFYMMMFFADELLQSEQKLRVNELISTNEKLAATLLLIINAFGYKERKTKLIDLCISLKDLANFARISYSSVNQSLVVLEQHKAIMKRGNELYVNDMKALKKFAKMEL